MALRAGHGVCKGTPRIEVLPADEQPLGLPAPVDEPRKVQPIGEAFDPIPSTPPGGGSVARGPKRPQDHEKFFKRDERTRELARAGGLARAKKARELKALQGLGLRGALPEKLVVFLADANEFARSEVERLALEDGAGVCPQNAAALVQQAALAMAGSRAAYADGETMLGARLGAEVRTNLLAARELTVLEAKTRLARQPRRDLAKELES